MGKRTVVFLLVFLALFSSSFCNVSLLSEDDTCDGWLSRKYLLRRILMIQESCRYSIQTYFILFSPLKFALSLPDPSSSPWRSTQAPTPSRLECCKRWWFATIVFAFVLQCLWVVNSSSIYLSSSLSLDPNGNLAKKKRVKYNKS